MNNHDWRQWVAFQDFVQAGPSDHALTISPRQPLLPDPHNLVGEPTQPSTVATNTVVGVVAPHHRGQAAMLVADRSMSVFPTPFAHHGHSTGKPTFGGDL